MESNTDIMGCDIHLMLEIRRRKPSGDGTKREWSRAWIHGSKEWSERNYGMFSVLADVRNYNDLPVIVPRRGFPDDASWLTRKSYTECTDYHSANWCTTIEMQECFKTVFIKDGGGFDAGYMEWAALLGAMRGYEMAGLYECRAVYWFDC